MKSPLDLVVWRQQNHNRFIVQEEADGVICSIEINGGGTNLSPVAPSLFFPSVLVALKPFVHNFPLLLSLRPCFFLSLLLSTSQFIQVILFAHLHGFGLSRDIPVDWTDGRPFIRFLCVRNSLPRWLSTFRVAWSPLVLYSLTSCFSSFLSFV